MDGHEHVDSGEAHAKECDGDHDTNEAAWSEILLDVLVAHHLITVWGDRWFFSSTLTLSLGECLHAEESEHEEVCGESLCFHYIFN